MHLKNLEEENCSSVYIFKWHSTKFVDALEKLGRRKLQQSTSSTGILHTTRYFGSKIDMMQDDNISKTLVMGCYYTPATILHVIRISKENPPCLFNQNLLILRMLMMKGTSDLLRIKEFGTRVSLRENWS
ncbi:hypothetical protein H5410_042501 [Solanum commersonii]|uniref:Uncharacterized protein n=1 Tax=Solanum commersonii TaxID=4109 RepID=A0A9J5XUI3_SOLCO|nr:hypothetical protein H5410_042501 [Solanum commersonii]